MTFSLETGMRKVWIEGYEGKYKIDDEGNVWRFFKKAPPKMMKPWLTHKCYFRVHLSGPKKHFYVHRLVALAFCSPPSDWENLHVRHKDGDSMENKAANLKWGTHIENIEDRTHHDKLKAQFSIRERVDIETKFEKGQSVEEICSECNYDRALVSEMFDRWYEAEWTF